MNQKVVAYPLSAHNLVVIQNRKQLKQLEIVGAVSAEISTDKKDTFFTNEKSISNVTLYDNFETAIKNTDAVLILPLSNYANTNLVISKIKYALSNNKRVFSMQKFDSDTLSSLTSSSSDLFTSLLNLESVNTETFYEKVIHRIETPLVVVAGLSDECELPNLQLQLRSRLKELGYKVSQIGSMNYSEAFGFHSIPSFMTDNLITASDKIYRFNRFVKEIEVAEQPDIMVLGLPNALCPYNNKFTLGFGIIPFYITQAVVSDYSIIALNYGEYNSEFIENMRSVLRFRFNLEPDCILMSDIHIDYNDIDNSGNTRHFTCGSEQVDKAIQCCEYEILNLHKESDLNSLVEQLIENLSNNYV
ncbi:TIGR04066 family peptide maturation system protein [Paenibacillus brasilensis]|uniref:Peptide maturation system protein (TIGR04066 family) n=1 Tax=Paenibacillus brasilensis TaxID=128574 RepID=A0ABU0L1R4_9BACL|nr:TIGR04066 family peptide maturation system protein [Paenibacillus brasilensis]MDQ0495632.1 peptide maturation system protein (TIGR04066 family) [Paenibacillus brasilensis]